MPTKKIVAIVFCTVVGSSALGVLAWQAIDDDVARRTDVDQTAQELVEDCKTAMRNTVSVLDDGIGYSDLAEFALAADSYRRAADLLAECVAIPGASELMQSVVDEVHLAADEVEKGDIKSSDAHFQIANDTLAEATKYLQQSSV